MTGRLVAVCWGGDCGRPLGQGVETAAAGVQVGQSSTERSAKGVRRSAIPPIGAEPVSQCRLEPPQPAGRWAAPRGQGTGRLVIAAEPATTPPVLSTSTTELNFVSY